PAMLSDRLAAAAMERTRRESILARTRGIIRRNLPVLEDWIGGHADLLDHVRPLAGAIAFLRVGRSLDTSDLVDRIRIEQSVLVVPGEQFGMEGYLRVGFGSDPEY